MSELQLQDSEFESPMSTQLKNLRSQITVVEGGKTATTDQDATYDPAQNSDKLGRREEREPREPVVKVTENEKGDMTISVPPTMEEAKKIAAEVPKAQRAATRQKYTSMIADIAITTLMVTSSIVLVAFAVKGLTSKED